MISPDNTVLPLCDLAPTYVRDIAPYQSGKPIDEVARELGISYTDIVKLASNENPLGFSPRVASVVNQHMGEISRYPDSDGFHLKRQLAEKLNVFSDQIVLGNGSNDILELVASAFLSSTGSAVYSEHAFIVYHLATKASGAKGIVTPAKNFGHDLQAMIQAIESDTRVIFIANPNNPTGTFLQREEIESFLNDVPASILVVLDEAYYEYLSKDEQLPSNSWINRFPNLLVCRTFSKAYGLAGLRIGYGIAHRKIVELLNRVRQPFNVGSIAQLSAVEALKDESFIEESVKLNVMGMQQITSTFQAKNIFFIPSKGNFVTFRVNNAIEIYDSLLKQGVIVRPVGGYGLKDFLRVSIGLQKENKKFINTLLKTLQG